MQSRKETAWKKSRKFGDIKGGRHKNKWLNTVLNRFHNLDAPTDRDTLPIYIKDNPSRDFYFPVEISDLENHMAKLTAYRTENITHIWLKKQSTKEFKSADSLQGCYIWGENVKLIVLYSFPVDNRMNFGKKKPSAKTLRWYRDYCTDLVEEKDNWYLQFTEQGIKDYYLNGLFMHEIGHHIDDVYKYSSASNTKSENWADDVAYYWSNKLREKID